MQPQKLRIGFAHFPYGGVGSSSLESPTVRHWKEATIPKLIRDPRIEGYLSRDFSDTPITMTRNAAVLWARAIQADVLVMIDSDMHPDLYVGHEPDAVPFWDSSFDKLHAHYAQGPLCIFSPYGGPPPFELPYVFKWRGFETDTPDDFLKLEMFTREEAAILAGFHEVGAGPTGLIMFDMRCFDLIDPQKVEEAIERGQIMESRHHQSGFCHYEWKDCYAAEKASTEDVVLTRELSLVGQHVLGYNPLLCNFSAWSGHIKPKTVGKPRLLTVDRVNEKLIAAVRRDVRGNEKLRQIDYTQGLDLDLASAEHDVCEVTDPVSGETLTVEATGAAVPPELVCKRTIFGREVTSLRFQTGLEDLEILSYLVTEQGYLHPNRQLYLAEVGSWVGESAIALHAGLGRCGGKLVCVDPWWGSPNDATGEFIRQHGCEIVRQTFLANVAGLEGIEHIEQSSATAVKRWARSGCVFDLVFLDGDHNEAAIAADIAAWLPLVRDEGILCGHDYFPQPGDSGDFPGVRAAVHKFFDPSIVRHPPGTRLWIVRMEDYVGRRRLEANGAPKLRHSRTSKPTKKKGGKARVKATAR